MMQSEDKLCVVVLFGGMSSEHEVSRVSAGTFVDNLDRTRYEVLTVGITKQGRWLYTEATSAQMADGSWEELPGNAPCVLSPDRADHGMILFAPSGQVEKAPCGCRHPRPARSVGRGRHRAGPAGTGRDPLCGLRRSGQRGLHG